MTKYLGGDLPGAASWGDSKALQAQFQRILPGRCLALQPLPLVPELRLWLVDAVSMQRPLTHDEAQAVVADPAYWSFCWASGQVLARWILDNPAWVRGRSVLDLGSGSGVVAIAAARAGARLVLACDSDPVALLAVACNARNNAVRVTCSDDLRGNLPVDLVCAADILYDRDNLPLLPFLAASAGAVLLADSRVRDLRVPGYVPIACREGLTWPDLDEAREFRRVTLYHCGPAPA